jgi:hypothetical protein
MNHRPKLKRENVLDVIDECVRDAKESDRDKARRLAKKWLKSQDYSRHFCAIELERAFGLGKKPAGNKP